MIILDIDNCIADDEWRIPHVDWKRTDPMARYRKYHELSPWDVVRNMVLYYHEPECLVLTARPVLYRIATEEWLRRAGVRALHLVMRNNDDHRPSLDVKRQQVRWLVEHYDVKLDSIRIAYDDRPEIVAMYQSLGIPAEVRAIHNTTAYGPKG